MNIIIRYNVFIDSSMRVSGTSEYFTINLKRPFVLTTNHSYFKCKIGSAEIPFVFQQVTASNNILSCRIQRGAFDNTFNITIQSGNYNITTLLSALSLGLTNQIFTITAFTPIFNFTYNKASGLVTLGLVGSDGISTLLTINFASNLLLAEMFGFTTNQVMSYSNLNVSTNITSTQNINVNPVSYILIRSDSLTQSQNFESIIQQDVISDIICKIQLTTQPGTKGKKKDQGGAGKTK